MMLLDHSSSFAVTDVQSRVDGVDLRVNPPKNRAETYVMHGVTAQRTVAIYHLILAPTHACNLRCAHCYLPDHSAQFLNKNVVFRLIREWNEIAGAETPGRRAYFHVKGGEPLVYKPLIPMIDVIRTLPHLHFMMTTNATLFHTKHWQALGRLNEMTGGAVTVVVSLDGATEQSHELLRGSGTFTPTIKAIRGLQQRRIRTYINSVIHAGNVHEMDHLVGFALESEVAQLNFLPFVPKGYGRDIRRRQLSHAVVCEHMRRIYEKLDPKKRDLLAGSMPHILAGEKQGNFHAAHECVAAYRGLLYVKPDGNTFTCPNLEHPNFSMGNVNKQSLRSILDNVSALYKSLHADGKSDRLICMGERKLYERTDDASLLSDLLTVQSASPPPRAMGLQRSPEVSFCTSRNW
jgi:MoaA/NifB/PqqE/SkfB family radical SAM enzyme